MVNTAPVIAKAGNLIRHARILPNRKKLSHIRAHMIRLIITRLRYRYCRIEDQHEQVGMHMSI